MSFFEAFDFWILSSFDPGLRCMEAMEAMETMETMEAMEADEASAEAQL